MLLQDFARINCERNCDPATEEENMRGETK